MVTQLKGVDSYEYKLIEKMGWRFKSDSYLKDILSITEDEDERSAIKYELGLREDINWHK